MRKSHRRALKLIQLVAVLILVITSAAGAAVPPEVYTDAPSYWNTPLDYSGRAPRHSNNANLIAGANDSTNAIIPNALQLRGTPDQTLANVGANPLYESQVTDPLFTVPGCFGGPGDITIRIPVGATPNSSADHSITILDQPDNLIAGFWHFRWEGGVPRADACDRQWVDSSGLAENVATATPSDAGNYGHLGVAAYTRTIWVDEVQSGLEGGPGIDHRLECFWHQTRGNGAQRLHVWPLYNAEDKASTSVYYPIEGTVVRIKPGVNLSDPKYGLNAAEKVIAVAFQKYGCLIGDNSGIGTLHRVERDGAYWTSVGVGVRSLERLTWNLWEFIRGGYDPRTGVTR